MCVVTGAGRGIGREYALMLAAEGAKVVVNDLGGDRDGSGSSEGPAAEVVEEIRSQGGEAVADGNDVSAISGASALVERAIGEFGSLHAVINNAGILRDRMLVNMSEQDWDDVIRVHLKGTFGPAQAAARFWRAEAKAGRPTDGRIINTTSVSGIYGNPGQTNYGAAKAGIAAFTFIASMELARYGVTVNAIAPAALTRLTEDLTPPERRSDAPDDSMSPRWIAPLVTWLASADSHEVTGRVFEASGRLLAVAEGWHRGPTVAPAAEPAQVGELVRHLLASARPPADMDGQDRS